jgi:hypothetical protein
MRKSGLRDLLRKKRRRRRIKTLITHLNHRLVSKLRNY